MTSTSLWYILYEISIFVAVLPIGLRVLPAPAISTALLLCTWLTLKLLASSAIPMIMTFLGLNSFIGYIIIAAIALMLGVFLYAKLGCSHLNAQFTWTSGHLTSSVVLLAFVAFAVGVGLSRVGPFSETDSLVNFSYVLEWAKNSSSPYFMAYHYSSFWEVAYIPIIALGGTDALLWWPAAQAMALLAASVYVLALYLTNSRWLSWGVLAASITLPAFWFGVSGIGTLKNDMIYNAGLILLVVSLISFRLPEHRLWSAVLAIGGLSFLAVKYSGPVLGFGIMTAWISLGFLSAGVPEAANRTRFAILTGGTALLVAGHYYIKNIMFYGNPLYPYPLHIGAFQLPGVEALPKTSLLSRANDLALWTEFFKSPIYGLALPASFLLGIGCSLYLVMLGVKRKEIFNDALIGASCVLSVLIYAASTFSDWLGPSLVSVRYATGAFILSLIAIVITARSIGRITTLLAVSMLAWCAVVFVQSSIQISFRYTPSETVLKYSVYAVVVAGIAFVIANMQPRFRPATLLALVPIIILAGNQFTEINRDRYWIPSWKPIVAYVSKLRSGERIFLVSASDKLMPIYAGIGEEQNLAPAKYPAVGPSFRNTVISGRLPDLIDRLKSGESFTAIAVMTWQEADGNFMGRVVRDVAPFGYTTSGTSKYAVLLQNSSAKRLSRDISDTERASQ
ncbi:hypothetical protein [Microvirga terrestris]|uniref:Glycosyltransferase RgtA/B/C/D-like domain-containing protein n=1 Tax=Microvirga terrestris TaxID=2791024 RepID=A0ABS0HQ60_9HYPH|nr:hypothetical protein [Microvirga terrestris]MBF9195362.1 hypothetical protein [Microvirga terrestris]